MTIRSIRVRAYMILRDLAFLVLGYKSIGGGVSGEYLTVYARKRGR